MPPTPPKLLEEPLIRSLPFLPKPIVETQSGKHRPVQIRRTVAGLLACRFNCPRGRSSPPRACRSVAVVQLWPWHRCHGKFSNMPEQKAFQFWPIREDGLKPGERDHFIDMSISITTARLTGPAGSATRTHGEVIILVKGNLRCHLINQLSEDEGQVVTVMVEHIAISCHF